MVCQTQDFSHNLNVAAVLADGIAPTGAAASMPVLVHRLEIDTVPPVF
jgi:hypothetical protein